MLDHLLLLAATDTIWTRLGVCAVTSVVGAILILLASRTYGPKPQRKVEDGGWQTKRWGEATPTRDQRLF
jgi:hypothetical protein